MKRLEEQIADPIGIHVRPAAEKPAIAHVRKERL